MSGSAIDLSLPAIERALDDYRPERMGEARVKRAAVACVLRFEDDNLPEVLLMQRAERKGDRWSGQVSFPGGREHERDSGLRDTAIRETREEVGIDLREHARPLGQLETIRALSRGVIRPLTVTPFVFVQTRPAIIQLDNHEAAAAFWLPLHQAAYGALSGTHQYRLGPISRTFPCWRYQGHVIWGMTYQLLNHFLDVVRGGS